MRIDLNSPYTLIDVAELIGSKDDSQHHQLRVSAEGYAYLSDLVGADQIDNLAFRLETFSAGTGYTGKSAAEDLAFVARIEAALRKNWPTPTSSYIEIF